MSITYEGMVSGFDRRPASRPRAAARSRATSPVRLTRRGRLVVVLGLLLVLVAGFSIGMTGQAATPSKPRVVPTVTVQPGETLWQVATRVAPDADPRLVIDQLVRLNHLSGAGVAAGQQLVVPSTR